jgi:ribosomal protein L3
VLNDGRNQYTYDAENRIVAVGPVSGGVTARYTYDAEGRRVAKLNASDAVTSSYVLGLGGEQVTVQNLDVVKVDAENNLIAIKGAIPGPKGSIVFITDTVKA